MTLRNVHYNIKRSHQYWSDVPLQSPVGRYNIMHINMYISRRTAAPHERIPLHTSDVFEGWAIGTFDLP